MIATQMGWMMARPDMSSRELAAVARQQRANLRAWMARPSAPLLVTTGLGYSVYPWDPADPYGPPGTAPDGNCWCDVGWYFRTRQARARWLRRRGYRPDGSIGRGVWVPHG